MQLLIKHKYVKIFPTHRQRDLQSVEEEELKLATKRKPKFWIVPPPYLQEKNDYK
jgi:hypothetical protein